jgi:hypothetical protein
MMPKRSKKPERVKAIKYNKGGQPHYSNGECQKQKNFKMKVKAPKGHHWMKQPKGGYKLMKHTGKFVKHKGASLEANFPIQKTS